MQQLESQEIQNPEQHQHQQSREKSDEQNCSIDQNPIISGFIEIMSDIGDPTLAMVSKTTFALQNLVRLHLTVAIRDPTEDEKKFLNFLLDYESNK